jgi:hypothetical protein
MVGTALQHGECLAEADRLRNRLQCEARVAELSFLIISPTPEHSRLIAVAHVVFARIEPLECANQNLARYRYRYVTGLVITLGVQQYRADCRKTHST